MKEVTINDISFEVLHKLIEFLYTDQSSFDGDSVLELFIAADKFDQPRLKYVKQNKEKSLRVLTFHI